MLLVYENRDKGISVEWKRAVHMPPHLHEAIEINDALVFARSRFFRFVIVVPVISPLPAVG